MGRKKWRRVRLADLATEKEQQRIADLIKQAQDPRRRPDVAQAGQKEIYHG